MLAKRIQPQHANNSRIVKIDVNGVETTFAGGISYGTANGTGTSAQFARPCLLAIDSSGVVSTYCGNGGTVKLPFEEAYCATNGV